MAIPELKKQAALAKLKSYCEKKCPKEIWDQVKLVFEAKGQSITVFEKRPYYKAPTEFTMSPVTKFSYKNKERLWSILWRDRNSKWHNFEPAITSKKFDELLEVLDKDETCIFWG